MGLKVAHYCAYAILLVMAMALVETTHAQEVSDTDGDGLYDYEELFVYRTDPQSADSDRDGFIDGDEVRSGYSPLVGDFKKMTETDVDGDGLHDALELELKTDLSSYDSDGDGISDGEEIYEGANPLVAGAAKDTAVRRVEVDLTNQQLHYFFNDIKLGSIPVSTGLTRTPTPRGEFKILRKVPVKHYIGEDFNLPNTKWNMEFLRSYYLHGAYWHNQFGIRPMSHGCVNIAYKDVEKLYKFMEIGDKVKIYGVTPWGRVKKVEPVAKR